MARLGKWYSFVGLCDSFGLWILGVTHCLSGNPDVSFHKDSIQPAIACCDLAEDRVKRDSRNDKP